NHHLLDILEARFLGQGEINAHLSSHGPAVDEVEVLDPAVDPAGEAEGQPHRVDVGSGRLVRARRFFPGPRLRVGVRRGRRWRCRWRGWGRERRSFGDQFEPDRAGTEAWASRPEPEDGRYRQEEGASPPGRGHAGTLR